MTTLLTKILRALDAAREVEQLRAASKPAVAMLRRLLTFPEHRCEIPEFSDGVNRGRAESADDARDALRAIAATLGIEEDGQ